MFGEIVIWNGSSKLMVYPCPKGTTTIFFKEKKSSPPLAKKPCESSFSIQIFCSNYNGREMEWNMVYVKETFAIQKDNLFVLQFVCYTLCSLQTRLRL